MFLERDWSPAVVNSVDRTRFGKGPHLKPDGAVFLSFDVMGCYA